MLKLFTTCIFVIVITHAFAQPATNVSPQHRTGGKFLDIVSDKKGSIYTVYESWSSIAFYERKNDFWINIRENTADPGIKVIHQLKGLSDGFVVFGQTTIKQQVVAIWRYGKWTRVPLTELKGKVNAIAVDDANMIWLSGEFRDNDRTAWLANWEKNKFTLFGPAIPRDKKLQTIFKTVNEDLFVTGSISNKVYLQMFDEKDQHRFFLTTDGTTWNTLVDNNNRLFVRDAVAIDKDNMYAVTACDGVDKCIIKWNGDKWLPVPMNDSFRNDKILSITLDNKGKLLIAGYTKADKDYSILEWDGNSWKQYGSQIKWNYKQIVDGKKEVYAITGNGEYLVRVPEDHNKPGARLAKKEPKALRVYQLYIEYVAEAKERLASIEKAFAEYKKDVENNRHHRITYFRTVVQYFRDAIQRTEVSLRDERLQRGENRMADFLRERIVIISKMVFNLKEAAEAWSKKEYDSGSKFIEAHNLAVEELNTHHKRNVKILGNYITENGL